MGKEGPPPSDWSSNSSSAASSPPHHASLTLSSSCPQLLNYSACISSQSLSSLHLEWPLNDSPKNTWPQWCLKNFSSSALVSWQESFPREAPCDLPGPPHSSFLTATALVLAFPRVLLFVFFPLQTLRCCQTGTRSHLSLCFHHQAESQAHGSGAIKFIA